MTLQIYKRFFIAQSSLLAAFKDSKCSANFFSFCFRDCAASKSSFSTASAFFARMASSSFCTTSGSSENLVSAALLLPVLLLLVSFFLAFGWHRALFAQLRDHLKTWSRRLCCYQSCCYLFHSSW